MLKKFTDIKVCPRIDYCRGRNSEFPGNSELPGGYCENNFSECRFAWNVIIKEARDKNIATDYDKAIEKLAAKYKIGTCELGWIINKHRNLLTSDTWVK